GSRSADSIDETGEDGFLPSKTSGDGRETEARTGPDCSDGTCFVCGDGMCPMGFYCDEQATGGAACSWLPECAETASCDCVQEVLGSSCSCEVDASGGPHVSCN